MDNKVYELVADRILNVMQTTGKLAWVKPWKRANNSPANGISKRVYDPFGLNFFILAQAPYASPFYLTYKQVSDLGGHVKKGEKAWPVVFWKIMQSETENSEGKKSVKSFPLLRYYNVFNVEQCEGINIPSPDPGYFEHNPIEAAEKIVSNYKDKPAIEIRQSERAFYMPLHDKVVMPELRQFSTPETFYSTFFHELGHSTGHKNRLDRKELNGFNPFGSENYGIEELTAELTAAFLCAESGVSNDTTERNSAAYVTNWMKAIKADPKMFVMAASKAGKAARYILGITNTKEETQTA